MKPSRLYSILSPALCTALCLLPPVLSRSQGPKHSSEAADPVQVRPHRSKIVRKIVKNPVMHPLELYGPFPIYGPPLPRDREANRVSARHLLDCCRSGALLLTVPERETNQLQELADQGMFCWPAPPAGVAFHSARQQEILAGTSLDDIRPAELPLPSRGRVARRETSDAAPCAFDPLNKPPSPLLLRLLSTLAARSTPQCPLELMSLLRPLYRTGGFVHVGPLNPHSLGLAADIAAYGGHRIQQEEPEECVAATLALLRDLPPGRYRLGMPKAPEVPLAVGRAPVSPAFAAWLPDLAAEPGSAPDRPAPHEVVYAAAIGVTLEEAPHAVWPFFPAPQPQLDEGRVAPLCSGGKPVLRNSKPVPCMVRFLNESYAEAEDLNDPRLKHALEAAQRRGVEIVAFFPDGRDHIHIDVRQTR